jgi:hypothetical protein
MSRRLRKAQTEKFADLTVERVGAEGDGIAHFEGKPVYLPFTVPGDRVRALLGSRRGGGREGRVVERLCVGSGWSFSGKDTLLFGEKPVYSPPHLYARSI